MATEAIQSTKLQIFTIWPFATKCADPTSEEKGPGHRDTLVSEGRQFWGFQRSRRRPWAIRSQQPGFRVTNTSKNKPTYSQP